MQDVILNGSDLETARWLAIYVCALLGVSSIGSALVLWLRSGLSDAETFEFRGSDLT